MTCARRPQGFTLVELTVVLVIVALLLGGMLIPLSAQQESRAIADTDAALAEIREALIGYALINKKLPCPMPLTVTDPGDAMYGREASNCSTGDEGILPWKTLGVTEVDAWGQKRSAAADTFTGYWRYRVHPNFATATIVSTTKADGASETSLASHAGQLVHVIASNGGEPPVAIVFSTGANRQADGRNGGTADLSYEAGERTSSFDDQLIWIARPLLFSRLAAAGKLAN